MAGNNRQIKKSSSGSISLFSIFKAKNSRALRSESTRDNDSVKAYKVWPSDEDRGRWGVAEPGIDQKAYDYIASRTEKWRTGLVAN
ncbi:Hypothetical predicted protein [Olea europaea subsp. europaea]|uniref:Uncharacterized protein n=1 Tax=Olea europaea subsp. europaea TaxID=158383 RepID=A0A8S0U2M7_OLEEU|nr:Hypothetical predicted protein [Olea europaea subsp. europaea]